MKRITKGKISALFEFTEAGRLKIIYLNAETDRDQDILWKGHLTPFRPPFRQRSVHGCSFSSS